MPAILDKIKKVKPIYWAIGGGVLIAAIVLLRSKSGGNTAIPGVQGAGGGGGDNGDQPSSLPNVPGLPTGGTGGVSGGGGTAAIGNPGGATGISVNDQTLAQYPGLALLQKYPSLGQFSTDQYGTINYGSAAAIPGFSALSPDLQAYWQSKLGGNFANVGNPDPAQYLAQWLYIQQQGLSGSNIMQKDLDTSLAYAKSYAQAAGVTQDQLAAQQQKIAAMGGIEGIAGYNTQQGASYFLANAGKDTAPSSNAQEYINSLRTRASQIFPTAPVGSGITYGQVADALSANWGLNGSTAAGSNVNTPPSTVPQSGTSTAVSAQTISSLQGYIANLSAVKNPTSAQQTELATYQSRLASYQAR